MQQKTTHDDSNYAKRIATKLRNFKSLIAHAREIEQDTETITRSLKERYINCSVYPIHNNLDVNLKHLQEIMADSSDFIIREIFIVSLNCKAAIIFMEGMADQNIINEHVIEKLTALPLVNLSELLPDEETAGYIKKILLTAASVTDMDDMKEAVTRLLSGEVLLIIDGTPSIFVVAARKLKARAISEPETETNIRGPRDGFTEELRVNVTLLRRRIKNPNLVVKKYVVGVQSRTDIAIVYFRGITAAKLIYEVEKRLQKLNIDNPANTGIIQGIMEDHPYSPFPTMLTTERPDKFIASLLEGRVGIIVDGTPFCLLAPAVFADFFQTGDDYYEKWPIASLIRLLRYITLLFGMATPAMYVAITTFHPGFLPTPLAITIGVSREGVPFPALIEALIMEFFLEILQEAGIRLPKTIGPAVSIVGALVIGESAVRAGLVSSSLVIVTAFTAIASFNIANYRLNLIMRLFRIPLMAASAVFGMFGLTIGLLAIGIHLSILESFGEPYLAPFVPSNLGSVSDLKDSLVITPPALREDRPAFLEPEDTRRQNSEH